VRSNYELTGSLEIMASQEQRKVKVGMVGGGPGAGIAETHRAAMRLDDRYELVAGVFPLAKSEGKTWVKADLGFLDVTDGVRGVSLVESAMRSYTADGAWTQVESI
jgi:hypothetical protein